MFGAKKEKLKTPQSNSYTMYTLSKHSAAEFLASRLF